MDEYGTEMWVEFQETPIATWWTIGLPVDMVLAVVVLCAFLYFSVRRNVDTTQVASKEHLDTIKTVKWHLEEELAAEAKKYLKNVEDAQKRKRKVNTFDSVVGPKKIRVDWTLTEIGWRKLIEFTCTPVVSQ
ncbi:hypothetical protein Q1695_009677 [Nippostrongylus brasiliensis]|nr:hypothetical protein Q1695_009677 [Nippostrongylus brasiliensis]